MKVLVELLVIVSLIALGWRQPFRNHVERILGVEQTGAAAANGSRRAPVRQTANPKAEPTPAPDSSWLWKPTKLDPRDR